MEHHTKPLLKSHVLIVVGGLFITCITLFGLLTGNVDQLIREDVRLGPVIAAGRVILPVFAAIGAIYYLAGVKKCAACGKILFWRRHST